MIGIIKRSSAPKRRLVLMVKVPKPGRVKTRLARDIGSIPATWWFRHQSSDLLRRLSQDPRWETILAVAPDCEGVSSRVWPHQIARIPQGTGDLGARMRGVFETLSDGPTMIIGADIPNIRPAYIWQGFRDLGRNDAVFGPAPDGGYWAIGLRGGARPIPATIFQGVRWSSETALEDTIASLGTNKIGYMPQLRDVDRGVDLDRA